MLADRWQEVEQLRRLRERERLHSLSITDSLRQFIQLMELADKLPKWGDRERLRQYETEQLVRWRKRMDALGRTEPG
ncbi:MAG: hypothetical protein ACETWG_03745 [Candidatus Neomarinimicrobiota bacterium]